MNAPTPGGTPPPPPAGPPFALPADTAANFLASLLAASQQVHLLQRGAPPVATLHRYEFTVQDVVNGFSRTYAPGPNNTPADDDTPP